MTNRHLRITVESDGKTVRPVDARIIPTELPRPGVVTGPLVYAASEDGKVEWTDSMPDPFERRSMPPRGRHEHHYSRVEKATFVLRVPLSKDALAPDFSIDVVLAKADVPMRVNELPGLFERAAASRRKRIGKLDLAKLDRLPEWRRLKSDAGLRIRGEGAAQ